VRIALNLKGLPYKSIAHHLRRGEQRAPEYLAINPQGLVPALELGDRTVLTQSLAIIEWLEETHPSPAFLPLDAVGRARVRAFALALVADTHPLQNLGVLDRLQALGLDEAAAQQWAADVNAQGLAACEALLPRSSASFCFGSSPSLADICLVPQLGNARRFGVDVSRFPRLLAKEAACNALPAFADAAPARQPDAE
jgi:maleylpyruvate isomerase